MAPLTSLGNILIVDEDVAITDLLQLNLCSEGYNVTVVARTAEVDMRNLRDYHLVLVDCVGQQPSGLEFIKQVKNSRTGDCTGVIYYSEYGSERTIIEALDAGADDCLRKPFSLREMLARIRAVMRRRARNFTAHASEENDNVVTIENMNIDLTRRNVTIDGENINLSNTEFSILELLLRNANTYTSRIEIFRKVWPDGTGANERIVDTNISRLRRKLGSMASCIANRQGLGYMIVTA